MDLINRCLFAKPWPFVEPKVTLSVGKFSVEKIEELGPCWAKVVDLRHPIINFAASAGLLDKKSLENEEEIKEVDLGEGVSSKSQRASVMVQTLTLTLNSIWVMMSQ